MTDGWEVEYAPEFERFWIRLSEDEQENVDAAVELLQQHGPALKRPAVGEITGSGISNLKELRVGTLRILFAFDPRAARPRAERDSSLGGARQACDR